MTFTNDALSSTLIIDSSNQNAAMIQSSSDYWSSSKISSTNISSEQLQQRTALIWIRTFIELDSNHLLSYTSGIIGAVLPCFSLYGSADLSVHRRGKLINK